MPCSQEVKIYNRSNIAESSIDFKYGPHRKKNLKINTKYFLNYMEKKRSSLLSAAEGHGRLWEGVRLMAPGWPSLRPGEETRRVKGSQGGFGAGSSAPFPWMCQAGALNTHCLSSEQPPPLGWGSLSPQTWRDVSTVSYLTKADGRIPVGWA